MATLNYCGNPLKDREEAQFRFETIFQPVLKNAGFVSMARNGNNMINPKTNQIVIVTSAPSNLMIVKATEQLIRKYRKEYKTPSITYLFTREISDYPEGSKPVYLAKLKKISSMNLLNGVATGMSMLPNVVSKLKNNEPFRLIA
jgi:hypothetical protein